MTRGILRAAAVALACATGLLATMSAANAATHTFANGVTVTQIPAEIPGTFDNNAVGDKIGVSIVCDAAYCGPIIFFTDGAVAQGNTLNISAAPLNDKSHYLFGVNGKNNTFSSDPLISTGALVVFLSPDLPQSFNLYWGSIDAANGPQHYDNTLTIFYATGGSSYGYDQITGSDLVSAGVFGVVGAGSRTRAADNQWFNIADPHGPILGFAASSAKHSFEFDMAVVPEPSTWAMMGLGFAALGYVGLRRSSKARAKALA